MTSDTGGRWALAGLTVCVALWAIHTARTSGYYDFLLLHYSAHGIVTGHSLYAGAPGVGANLNPPHTMLLLAPLGWLRVDQAVIVVWAGIGASAWVLYRLLQRSTPAMALPLMLVLVASPAWYLGMRLANLAWPLAVGVTVAWLLYRSGRRGAAGLLLGSLAATKLFLLLFGPYLVWRRQWLALTTFGLGLCGVFAGGVLLLGPATYGEWLEGMQGIIWEYSSTNMTLLGLVTRAFTSSSDTFGMSHPLAVAPWLIRPLWLAACAIVVAAVWARFRSRHDEDAEWAVVLTAAFLLSPLAWIYYLPMAAGPVGAVLGRSGANRWVQASAACFLVPYTATLYLSATAAWGTLTAGSAYTAGALLLWWQVLRAPGVVTKLTPSRP